MRRHGPADALTAPARLEWAVEPPSRFEFLNEPRRCFHSYPPVLAIDRGGRRLKLAEVRRDDADWHEAPLKVEQARWPLLEQLGQTDMRLELASRVAPIDYVWRIGRSVCV